jgi:two-component system, OmpR family, sensor kinase
MSGRWLAGRTLGTRLIVSVLLLLTTASAIIGVVTYLAVRNSIASTLNSQLRDASTTYSACISNVGTGGHQPAPGGNGYPPAGGFPHRPRTNSSICAEGQPQGMLGVHVKDGRITACSIVDGMSEKPCSLSAADTKALLALPVYQPLTAPGGEQGGQPPSSMSSAPVYGLDLSSLDGAYQLTATKATNGDVLITGLPTSIVDGQLRRDAIAELAVFLSVLLLAGVLGTIVVRLQLRPLRRVAATATQVTELPLDSGEVSLPAGVPDTDPRTEVGQVGAAFNRMLGHVERALGRRAASEARLRRFAADASHELRTPLSSIRGYAELALRHPGPVPPEVTHALRRVQSESARMSVLVDDLLLLARLDAGRPLEQAPVDLSRLAIDATSDAHVARRDHHWRLDLPDSDDPVLVLGDEHRLHQVLANLLSNAGKHTPAGSTVTIGLTSATLTTRAAAAMTPDVLRGTVPAGPVAELSVTDDGPGVPPEVLPELFERFARGDTSRARSDDGAGTSTGLGLAIVAAVVTAHGGCVTAASAPGQTRFAVILPLLHEPATQTGQAYSGKHHGSL